MPNTPKLHDFAICFVVGFIRPIHLLESSYNERKPCQTTVTTPPIIHGLGYKSWEPPIYSVTVTIAIVHFNRTYHPRGYSTPLQNSTIYQALNICRNF